MPAENENESSDRFPLNQLELLADVELGAVVGTRIHLQKQSLTG
jgi:hypothetical protein